MLIPARVSEVGGLTWNELDPVAGTWSLPKERSKNHRSYTLTLPEPALAITRSTPRRPGREHLFGRGKKGFTGWRDLKRRLDERLNGAVKPWRLHDLRRSTVTHMAERLGVQPHIISVLLNHHRGDTTAIYNRATYVRETRAALARWADHLLALAEGRGEGTVVQLHG